MAINKVMVSGHIGADPVLRYTPSGMPAVVFNLYQNIKFKMGDKKLEDVTKMQRYRVIFYGAHAENLVKNMKKGSEILVEGQLISQPYKNKKGEDRVFHEIRGQFPHFLGRRKSMDLPEETVQEIKNHPLTDEVSVTE